MHGSPSTSSIVPLPGATANEPLVLATVYETAGSTYSKAGQRILLAANGEYRGLVSGGCLEGDLAERARGVIAAARAAAVTYDLRDSADDLWGLGVGCNGLLRVFLQPLLPASDYQPFGAIAERLAGTQRAGVATIIESQRAGPRRRRDSRRRRIRRARVRRGRCRRRSAARRRSCRDAEHDGAARDGAGLPHSLRAAAPDPESRSCSAPASTRFRSSA